MIQTIEQLKDKAEDVERFLEDLETKIGELEEVLQELESSILNSTDDVSLRITMELEKANSLVNDIKREL